MLRTIYWIVLLVLYALCLLAMFALSILWIQGNNLRGGIFVLVLSSSAVVMLVTAPLAKLLRRMKNKNAREDAEVQDP